MSTVRKLGAVAMMVIALTLGACTSSPGASTMPLLQKTPLHLVDLSATPPDWVAVAYGDAQVSVPSTFSVFYQEQSQLCGPSSPGELFVGPPQGITELSCPEPPSRGKLGAQTVVRILIRQMPKALAREKPIILNGVAVYAAPHASKAVNYFAPSLHIEVAAQGPMARQVIHTLTRSPRDVALEHGPAPSVPSSWRSVTFAGLRYSVPAAWPIRRTQVTPGLGAICHARGVAFPATTVTLSTDERPLLVPPCAYIPPYAHQPENGAQVDSGLRAEPLVTLSSSTHCLDLLGLTACPATSPAYSILVLRVTVPWRSKPVIVSIGLAGNGIIARTVLDLLRAA
jgi:hypothetical protein